ncbi:MAG: hypothetical protein BGO69_03480 [Bacteroidetes bacterium 46-16]|nr:MAG: hypothetical protein BGO69_03480 [Bacteroidetes bacterium 46-16]
MESIKIKEIFITDPEYGGVYELRETLLRRPIGLSLENEDLSADRSDHILAATVGEKVIACIMLQPRGGDIIKFRQMAVASAWQGKDVGMALLRYAEAFAKEKNYRQVVLHARVSAEGFYQKAGYRNSSDIFTEVGIDHVLMEKSLNP